MLVKSAGVARPTRSRAPDRSCPSAARLARNHPDGLMRHARIIRTLAEDRSVRQRETRCRTPRRRSIRTGPSSSSESAARSTVVVYAVRHGCRELPRGRRSCCSSSGRTTRSASWSSSTKRRTDSAPSRGIFPTTKVSETSYFNASALFAIVMYLIFVVLVHALLSWLTVKKVKHQQQLAEAEPQQ